MSGSIKNEKIPAYVMVYNELYSDLMDHKYENGSIFPSETELSKIYNVSRSTLRQALAILNEDGLIIKSQGKGTIVNLVENKVPKLTAKKNPCLNLSNKPVDIIDTLFNYGVPTEIAKDKLQLSNSEIVLALKTTYGINDEVYSYCFIQVPTNYFDDLNLDLTKEEHAILKLSQEVLFEKATNIDYSLKPIALNQTDAEMLKVEVGSTALLIEGIFYMGSHAFARVKYYLLPDKYQINISI